MSHNFDIKKLGMLKVIIFYFNLLPSATKLRRLCFYTCLSFCSQWGSASVHAGIPPGPRTPPGTRHTPPEQTPPGSRHLRPRSRHPPSRQSPWEQTSPTPILPGADTPPPETATVADGTHPTGMHSCFKLILHISFESNHWKLNVFKPKFNEFCTLI